MNFGLRKGTKLKGKELTEKLKELNSVDNIICGEQELNEYIMYGLLVQVGNKYITRTGKSISVDLVKQKRFNIDLSQLISKCNELAKQNKIKRIYCMTQTTYNMYKQKQLIIEKQNVEYFRLFDNELWQIYIIQ